MPRRTISLEAVRDTITEWYQVDGMTIKDISARLKDEFKLQCAVRTIEKRFKQWGITKNIKTDTQPGLELKIASFFYMNYPDAIIVRALNEEGRQIGPTAVARIRRKIGCHRRMPVEQRLRANEALWDIVRKEIDSGRIEGYGKELLHKYFRTMGLNTTRHDSFSPSLKIIC